MTGERGAAKRGACRGPARSTPLAVMLLIAGCISTTVIPIRATETPAFNPATTPTRRVTPETRSRHPYPAQRTVRAWWHEPRVTKELHLTAEQLAKMDGILARRIEERRRSFERQRRIKTAFHEALVKGDWAAARHLAHDMRGLAAAEAEARAALRIAVFQVLSAEQRRILAQKHPNILARPWLPGYGRRKPLVGGLRSFGKTPQQEQ